MIKRILVALDPDPDTETAIRYAIDIASVYESHLTGLAIVDTRDIEKEIRGAGIGALYYAERLREKLSDEVRKLAHELGENFKNITERYCDVCASYMVEEGVPAERISEDTKYHDLLVLGKSMHFFYTFPEKETDSVSHVVKHSACPVLLVGKEYREINHVLMAFDGKVASATAIQRFAQLKPLGTDFSVEVVHVRRSDDEKDKDESALLLRLMQEYLESHGFEVRTTSIAGEDTQRRLLDYVDHVGADMVVAGAHGEAKFLELAMGSTVYSLIRDTDVPVFVCR